LDNRTSERASRRSLITVNHHGLARFLSQTQPQWNSTRRIPPQAERLLRVTEGDDDGVIGIECDQVMKTAPLGVVSGAVVVALTGCWSA
jgi:hypothetical protein